jgi:hypothetical protein
MIYKVFVLKVYDKFLKRTYLTVIMQKENKFLSIKNIMTILIVVLMVGSVIGYMFGRNSEDSLDYNGYKFFRRNNKFILKIDKTELGFDYFPSNVEDINISTEILNKFSNKVEIDVTSNNNSKFKEGIAVAQYDIEQYLNTKGTYLVKGLTTENDLGVPVIVCENATIKVPVIYFKESNQTKVYINQGCIILEAEEESDFIRIKDRLIYGLLGVIE